MMVALPTSERRRRRGYHADDNGPQGEAPLELFFKEKFNIIAAYANCKHG